MTEDGAGVARRRVRRRHGTLPARPASPPDDDDMLREILLRLPPQPSSLLRASAVCKRWRGLVTDPRFLRRFRAHHRKPPLLGFFKRSNLGKVVFTPILGPPDRIPPRHFDLGRYRGCDGLHDLIDCRHGLVLVKDPVRNEVVVCDPIAGQQRRVAVPLEFRRCILKGAVLCAAGGDQGHVHGSCHSSPFKVVVMVSMYGVDNRSIACVYSSESGIWGNLISTPARFTNPDNPAILVGNRLYWLSLNNGILEFDLDEHNLTMILRPAAAIYVLYGRPQIFRAEGGAVGYAILSYHRFQAWRRIVNGDGVATWVPWKTIDMHSIAGLPSPRYEVKLLGYDEDTDVLFLSVVDSAVDGVYMVQFKSMQAQKLTEIRAHFSKARYYPFKSFYTPGTAINGGSNELKC